MSSVAPTRTSVVESLMERFPGIPREAVLKEDLLRGGVASTPPPCPATKGVR